MTILTKLNQQIHSKSSQNLSYPAALLLKTELWQDNPKIQAEKQGAQNMKTNLQKTSEDSHLTNFKT